MDQDDAVVLEDDKEEDREVADVVKDVKEAKFDEKVVTAASETITAASAIITTVEAQVLAATLTISPARVVDAPSRRRKGVEPKPLKKKKQIEQDEQYARELQAELNKNIDWDEAIDHVKKKAKEDHAVKRYQLLKRNPQTEAQARKNMMVYLKNVAGFQMDYFKGMSYDDIRLIFKAKFNSNVAFLLKIKEQIEEDENRALKRLNETSAKKAAKRQKLDKEVEELKRHLQIVPKEDDDVYTEATPLARKNEVINHVKFKAKENPAMKKYQAMKRKPQTEAQARKNMMLYLKNVASFNMDYFKGMYYDDIRPIFEAKFNSNVAFLLKTKEQIEEDEIRALQKLNETPAEKAAKRRKLDEEIVEMNNKPYYKIIRADDTHQLYISFLTLLRNFDREDLEALWSLVKERFSTTKPKNFFDDFLLVTLGAMFEKPDIHAQIWKNQRTVHGPAKVKGWKLLKSCGVQIITFTSTQLILLVERKYPLTRFTLDQILNAVRLEVEEESEVSLELLRFTRPQHQEGQLE
nr:hypothetical protein [Tanacetum cinerariifolium]